MVDPCCLVASCCWLLVGHDELRKESGLKPENVEIQLLLENELEGKLDFAGIPHRTENLPYATCLAKASRFASRRRCVAIDQFSVFRIRRHGEIGPIKEIKELGSKLNTARFADPEVLDYADIQCSEIRSV